MKKSVDRLQQISDTVGVASSPTRLKFSASGHIVPSVDEKLISTTEAARRLGISVSRLHVLLKQGRIPYREIAGRYLIDANQLRPIEKRKSGRPKTKAQPGNESD